MPGRRQMVAVAVTVVGVVALYNLLKATRRQNRSQQVYVIQDTWDSKDVGHDKKVTIELSKGPNNSLKMSLTAPFFNNPPAPEGQKGQPFPELWDYEVVEAFFLTESEKYLEVELCPHGQHLVLMLNGRRKPIKDKLPLTFSSVIEGETWKGEAVIPGAYLPPGVTKFNAYAIHGAGDQRQYEALYPAPNGKHTDPDFHRLEYFQRVDITDILPENSQTQYKSELWES